MKKLRLASFILAIVAFFALVTGLTPLMNTAKAEKPFTQIELDFESSTDASLFTGSYWKVSNGTLKEGTAWGTTQLNTLLPLDQNLTVTFDFSVAYTGAWDSSFIAFGFMSSDLNAGTIGWVQRTTAYGDLLTWRKNGVGGPTSNDGVGDQIIRSTSQVENGDSAFTGVHSVKIVFESGNMTVYVDGVQMYMTNQKVLTCDLTEGYFTIRGTNTSTYIDNLKIVKTDVSDDYSEDFSDKSAFTNSGVSVDTANKQYTGSGWSYIDYKQPTENYRLDMKIKLNTTVSGATENQFIFGNPTGTFANGTGGYLLHFYNSSTWIYDNSIKRANGWYDSTEGVIISKFNNFNIQHDGEWHDLTISVYENQFYLILDGVFFTFNNEKIYTAKDRIGEGFIRFIGHDWELNRYDITTFGGVESVGSAHFNGIFSIYDTVSALNKSLYSNFSWAKVESLRDEYIAKLDAKKNSTDATVLTALTTEAVEKINAVPQKSVVPADVVGENQVLIGYQITGGGYNGLYNFNIGDELPDSEDITLEPVVATMYMQKGVSMRVKDGGGIRWKTNVNASDYADLVALGAEFGTKVTSVGSTKSVDIPVVNGLTASGDTCYFIGALTNIKPQNYSRVYNGQGYVKVTYADGTTDVKYAIGNDNARTYNYVANKIYSDVKDQATGEYINAVQKDDKTVYSKLPLEQFNFVKKICADIIKDQTSVVGTGAEVHILNLCQGEEAEALLGSAMGALCIIVRYNETTVMFDAGRPQTAPIVVDYLNDLGVKKIDYLISSHSHIDHIGGMPSVVENFDIGTFIYKNVPGVTDSDGAVQICQNLVSTLGSKINSDQTIPQIVEPDVEGYKVELDDGVYFQIFNCQGVHETLSKSDLNYYSLEMYLVAGTATAFFGGDAVGLYENTSVLENVGKVDLYQAQHHGQGGLYSPDQLIDALQPKATVSSIPWNNQWNGNYADTVEKCSKYGKYYVSGSDGHLVFKDNYGSFVPVGDSEDRFANNQKVNIEMTELEFTGTKYAGEDGNVISGRGAYTGATTGTAFVINVPESMTGISVINLDKGQSVYPNVNGLRFRIILNDTVLYDSNVTQTTSTGNHVNDIILRFTVKAGDKIYFVLEGSQGTYLDVPVGININGQYFAPTNANYSTTGDGTKPAGKDFFCGVSDKGSVYTCEEILTYASVVVTEVE